VLTGGWQTDRERAYVALTRAQDRTDVYICREDLGEQGMDAGAIERLGEAMVESHAHEASIKTALVDRDDRQPSQLEHERDRDQERTSEAAQVMRESEQQHRDLGLEIE
jgi:hypothetical protein